VILSLANGFAHAGGLWCCQRDAKLADAPRGWLWWALGLASVHAWFWAAVFHCRDVYWTQVMGSSVSTAARSHTCVRVWPRVASH
jgi:hypothetical protein